MTAVRIVSVLVAAGLAIAGGNAGSAEHRQWTWPLSPGPTDIVAGFDPPAQPWYAGHRGVDLAAPAGGVVRAAGAGIVTYAGRIAGVGVVAVTHGELRTTYQPVEPDVSAGQRVVAGQPVGTLAATNGHCLPETCLHWGLLRGDTYLDPLGLVRPAGGPRLLPLGEGALDPAADVDIDVAGTGLAAGPVPARPAGAVVRRAAHGALAGVTAGRSWAISALRLPEP